MAATQVTRDQTVALATAPGQRLRADAAAAWDAAARECQATHGWTPTLTDSYRPFATQERIFRERYTTTPTQYAPGKTDRRVWNGVAYYRRPGTAAAAVPGTSNHGSGIAVDAGRDGRSFATFDDKSRTQFLAIAARHGWSDDEGRSVAEPWHLTHTGYRDIHPTPTPAPAPARATTHTDDLEVLMAGYPFIIRGTDSDGWTLVLSPAKQVQVPALPADKAARDKQRAAIVAIGGEPRTVGPVLAAAIRQAVK